MAQYTNHKSLVMTIAYLTGVTLALLSSVELDRDDHFFIGCGRMGEGEPRPCPFLIGVILALSNALM